MQEYDETGRIKCDKKDCENRATVNYQTGTVKWEIDDKGKYSFRTMYDDGLTNDHWCDDHDGNEL